MGSYLWAQDVRTEHHHCLMEENSFSFGIGIPYSINENHIGINSRLYYNVGESLCFGPEVSYFNSTESEIWDMDLAVHYIIETPWVGLYPLGGLNYTRETKPHFEEAFGFLWGAGLHRNVQSFTLFAEYSRVESKLAEQFISAGIMYRFKLNRNDGLD